MAQNVTQRFPFSNKGVVQKLDINQLQDGQYSLLLNAVSEQEGSLSPRYGHTNLTGTWPAGTPSYINTLHVTQVGATSSPTLYAAENTSLYRKIGTTSGNYTLVASDTVSTASAHKRIGMATYKTDQIGTTGMTYIATGANHYPGGAYMRGMLRDNGTSTAKYWGILPPAKPADITPSAMTIAPIIASGTYNGLISISSTRISGIISSAVEQPPGSKFYKISFTSAQLWLPGMYITCGAQSSVIEKVDSTGAIFAYFGSAPSGATVESVESTAVSTTPGQTYTATSNAFSSPGLDLSFGATNDNEGYVTDDTIAFSFYTSTPEKIYDIRLRLYTNSSDTAYYEKAISPGIVQDLQNAVSSNATINPASPDVAADENGVSNIATNPVIPTGDVIKYDTTQVGLNPAYLTPSKAGSGGWSQVEISKRSFLALGNAGTVDEGSGGQGWKSIYKVEVVIRPTTTSAVVTFKLGSIFAYGGKGVNSNYGAKLTPYSYVYTYKNKATGAESNPSIEMIPENTLNLVRQGINVNMRGTSKTDTQNFSSEVDTICIYRSGGTFADGLYRRVGVIDNPGATEANFVDTADDLSIAGAPIAEFDNDAPVTSDIGQEYKYNLKQNYSKGVSVAIELKTVTSGLRDILTPGTIVNIGGGIAGATGKQESCIVLDVNASSFTTYLQYDHKEDEAVIWDTNAGTACDVVCSAFNRMWVAGDVRNPHILYSSKTGRPEVFPVINQGTGNPHVLAVSSPDNPINGIAEFNGELVCLCQNGIYTVRLDNGRLVGPFKTPANRGLVLKYAWGYVDNEIWFLSNDGIYAWGGGAVRKVTFAVDFIFNNKVVNGISYFNRITPPGSLNYYQACNIQQKNNEVFFNYINADGWFFILRYHILFDRWSIDEVYDPQQLVYQGTTSTRNGIGLKPVAITALAADKAAGVLYAAKTVGSGSWPTPTFEAFLINYDNVSTFTDNGQSVYYEANTKFYDMGASLVRKSFTDIGIELTSGTAAGDMDNTFFYKVYYDYANAAGDAAAIVYASSSRQIAQFPLQQSGSPLASEGKEARAAMFSVYGQSKAYNILHNFAFTFIPLSETIKGRVTDWDDLGHPFDKRLFNVTIEYDNNNTELVLYLDTVGGLNSGVTTLGTQTIILPPKVGRAKSSIPVTADIIAKMVRLRPKVASVSYQIFNYSFQKEDYPRDVVNNTDWSDLGYQYEKRLYQLYINCDTGGNAVSVAIEADGGATPLQTVTVNGTSTNRMQSFALDKDLIGKLIRLRVTSIPSNAKFQLFDFKFDYEQLPKPTILSTPWNDFGYDYLKYAEQISFDVNTNGKLVPVSIYGDGAFKQTVTVTGTQADRNQIITLNPALTFRTMRLEVGTIPSDGRFQLWDYRPIFRPADKGEVYHTFDWDDLQYPYDKKLTEISIEFETGVADDVRIAIDTLSGVDGTTQTLAFQTLTLPNTNANRGFKTFPINETVCKMIRIRALGRLLDNTLPASFKMYGYKVGNVVQYPADIVNFTDWSDLGYEYEKRLYQLYVNCDTNGLNVSVNVEADGGILQTVTVNGSSTNRMQAIPLNKDLIGRQIRLSVLSVPAGAKFQLFDYKFDFEKLPAPIVRSTPWTDFGYDYLKYAEQISFDVNTNGQPVPVGVYGDGSLMQTVTVTGTQANRNQIITLNPALTFRTMRLEVGTIPAGGRFQLWEYRPIFRPADKGEVYHTFDWDDLQYPYDKKLTEVSIEFETGVADDVKIAIDTLTGIDGATQTLAFQTLTLPNTSGTRGFKTFPINETVCKMIRIRAIGSGSPTTAVLPASFKMYGYKFGNVIQYPADIVNFTDWSNLGYEYEKRLYQLHVNCDTNGQNVSVNVEADGSILQAVTINGTATNRMQAIPLNKDLIGRQIRLNVVSIPAGGKFQLFDSKFDFEQLPKPTILSTPWTDFGYDYLKYAEQISFDVNTNGQPVPVGIYGDGTLMQTVTVTGTQANRNQIITLNPALTFRTMRLEVGTVPVNGRFQLWDYRPIFRPADKGEVYHTFDWDDLQYPYDKKLTEVTIEFETGTSDDVKIALDTLSGLDGTTLTSAFQTLTLPNTSGTRGFKTFAINETICKMIRIRAIGSGNPTTSVLPASFKMYGYKFGNVTQYPPDIVFFTDWSDLGYQYEKRFYQLFMNCDTNGYDVTVNIEADGDSFGIGSIASYGGYVRINSSAVHYLSNGDKVYIKGVTGSGAANVNGTWLVTVINSTSFMLIDSVFTGSPTGGTAYKILQQIVANATTTNRMLTFAMDKDLIGKLVRLNVVNIPANGKFQLFDHKFDYEQLPKPIILSTPWSDFGYDYLKYAEQIAFDINTNGVQIPVDIYCDGVWKQRVVVEGTQQSRNFNCTLNPAITFQTMRLQVNPDQIPDGGRFQLWEYKPIFRQADKGPVYHTFDWDNLEHPYDKKISEVTIEFETNGKDVVVALDTLTGINGNTENLAVQTFTLNSTGRGYKTFPIPETICKMIRIRTVSTAGRANRLDPDFKMWGYRFGNTVPYPPDIQRFSEWTDLDYPCDKIFRGVGLTIDTGGVNCTVVLEVDGVAKQTFTVNTTSSTRQTFLTAQNNTEIIGKMYRLTFTPGTGGKAQVFGAPQFNTVKDSCPFVFLDSYEQGLGSAGYSVLKQFWADYKCDGSITVKFYNEYNVLFYSKTLGPHASRDVERFYLPAKNGSVINKSKKHRITIEAVDPTKPFKWYRDTSRLEYINLSADQRQGYFQFIPWTNMQLPV